MPDDRHGRSHRRGASRASVRVVVVLCCLAVAAGGMLVLPVGTASAGPVLDGMAGRGTAADPYVVTNATELQAMNESLTANFTLGNDIDAAATAGWNGGAGFVPVGNSTSPFTGSLDGQGHVISDLVIDRAPEISVGLFGHVGPGGSVENVTLENVSVTGDDNVGGLVGLNNAGSVANSSATGSVTGNETTGGLVGDNLNSGAVITNSSASVTVTGGAETGGLVGRSTNAVTIANSSASGTVDGDTEVGGLVGLNTDTVTDSYATGAVNGSEQVGGLVGNNEGGEVSTSFAAGSVNGSTDVGGLVGLNDDVVPGSAGAVTDSYATGPVNGSTNVGGLVGASGIGTPSVSVTDSFATGAVAGTTNVSGLVGYNQGDLTGSYWDVDTTGQAAGVGAGAGTATGLPTANMTGVAALTNMSDLGFYGPFVLSASYPDLLWEAGLDGDGSAPNPFEVDDVYHLQTLAGNLSANYTLSSDVDASATAGWNGGAGFVPVGNSTTAFTGSLDGDGHTISDLVIDRSAEDDIGVFGFMGTGGSVSNVTLENTSISGNDAVGALVGENSGSVANSSANGTVSGSFEVGGLVGSHDDGTVANSSASGAVTGDGSVGGLAGFIHATVTDSAASGPVTASGDRIGGLVGFVSGGSVTDSYATGTVDGDNEVGGLVGRNAASVTGSYATGAVNGTDRIGGLVGFTEFGSVTESYATGSVDGEDEVGGLVGRIGNLGFDTLTNLYATGNVTGTNSVGGLVGSFQSGSVDTSYATGNVTAVGPVGGLIGNGLDSTTSYWDVNTSGQPTPDRGIGYPTANMTGAPAETNMSAFDFDDTWTTTDDYPHLQWEVTDLTLALNSATLTEGDTTEAIVTLSLVEGSTVTASTVANYTSDDTSVATVAAGVVTAQGAGDTDLTAEHVDHDDVVALSVQSSGPGGSGGSSDDDDERTTGCGPPTALGSGDVRLAFDEDVLCVRLAFVDDASGTVTVDVPGALPADVDPLPGSTGLVFIDVTVPSSMTDSEATLQLTLDADALGNVDPADLVVYRYDGGEWTALETAVVSTTSAEVVIEATTPGFSLFAVGPAQQTTPDDATPDSSAPDDATPDDGTSTPDDDRTLVPATSTPGADEPGGDSGLADVTLLALLVAAIVVVALALVAVRRRS